jgi:hypothetical protein
MCFNVVQERVCEWLRAGIWSRDCVRDWLKSGHFHLLPTLKRGRSTIIAKGTDQPRTFG